MRRSAFTLIELLVVIAIIAILAAILFPVFAQAKEAAKKTQTLAQFKQVGTSAHIYLADHDDRYPLSMSYNSVGNVWRHGNYHAVPNGWTTAGSRHLDPRRTEEGSFVLNALQPYIKNLDIYSGAGLANVALAGVNPAVAGYEPVGINVTYNGFLHAWSSTAVASPSKLPMMLQNYKENTRGMMISNPVLCCTVAGPACQFNGSGYPQPGQTSCAYYGAGYGYVWFLSTLQSNFTVWVYGRGMAFIAADTSARMIQFNAPNWPQYAENVNSSPWSSFDGSPGWPKGSPYWMTDCVQPGGTKGGSNIFYAGFFRPDSEYNYTLQQCDFGGG